MSGPMREALDDLQRQSHLERAARAVNALFSGNPGRWTFDGFVTAGEGATVLLALREALNDVEAERQAADADAHAYAARITPALEAVAAERLAQDEKWGGPDHDDRHTYQDWMSFIEKHLDRARRTPSGVAWRKHLVRVAALAVAAVESFDRRTRPTDPRLVRDTETKETPVSTVPLPQPESLEQAVQMFAGAVSTPFMRDNPSYEMPSEELEAICREWFPIFAGARVPVILEMDLEGDVEGRNAVFAQVPREGDWVAIWHDQQEHHFQVRAVTWSDGHLGQWPRVSLATDGYDLSVCRSIMRSTERP